MKPMFVCQLPQEQQQQIEKMLRDMLIEGAGGDEKNAREFLGCSLEEAVQNGMDSKIVDLDYLMIFYSSEFIGNCEAEYKDIPNAVAILDILRTFSNIQIEDFQHIQEAENDDWER